MGSRSESGLGLLAAWVVEWHRSADEVRGLAGVIISFVMSKYVQDRAVSVLPRCGGGTLASGPTCPARQGG